MSFLETLLLPGLILPHPVTFVVKQSLLEYPVFKHVMRSSNPIAVSRTNPRQDLKTVLEEGVKRLEAGFSVVVFPQSTRSHVFDPSSMSSIGVKLAKKANVPIVPLALKTDALRNGSILKDFGKIDHHIPVRLAFDAPIRVSGKGNEEHELINGFIERKLQQWAGEAAPVLR
jgi:1-acyl-sn-glycerol-3-phosphate acyltransferase